MLFFLGLGLERDILAKEDTKERTDKNPEYIIPAEGCKQEKKKGNFNSEHIKSSDEMAGEKLDENILKDTRQIEYESDKGYQKIAKEIVNISKEYLNNQNVKKSSLRKIFTIFFTIFLSVQFACLIMFILFNSFKCIEFKMSEYLLTTYIVSVFVETLGTISVMLAFSFTSKEESSIVAVLTTVIQNYQKYFKDNSLDRD